MRRHSLLNLPDDGPAIVEEFSGLPVMIVRLLRQRSEQRTIDTLYELSDLEVPDAGPPGIAEGGKSSSGTWAQELRKKREGAAPL